MSKERDSADTDGDIMTEADLAARWRCSKRTLARRRRARQTPPSFRVGRRRFYRREDVRAFEEAARDLAAAGE